MSEKVYIDELMCYPDKFKMTKKMVKEIEKAFSDYAYASAYNAYYKSGNIYSYEIEDFQFFDGNVVQIDAWCQIGSSETGRTETIDFQCSLVVYFDSYKVPTAEDVVENEHFNELYDEDN